MGITHKYTNISAYFYHFHIAPTSPLQHTIHSVLFQRVLFLLRGAPSEVHLLICRPAAGVLYDVDNNTLVSSHRHKYTCSHKAHNMHMLKYKTLLQVSFSKLKQKTQVNINDGFVQFRSVRKPAYTMPGHYQQNGKCSHF